MRPPRADIGAPPFPPETEWVGDAPPEMARLTAAGPVLVHFLEVGEPSAVRTVPYVVAWSERYADRGLTVLGVHSPGFPFSSEPAALSAALARLGIPYPVANDRSHRIWRDYGCEGWPSLFLWGRGGTLRWYHFGEGAYQETEEAIRELLTDGDAPPGDLLPPLRDTDARDARVVPPSPTSFPGGSRERPWDPGPGAEPLELEYAAGGAHATVEGTGELTVTIDGGRPRAITIDAPGSYELAEHERHGTHRLALAASPGLRIWSLGFSAGLP